MKKLIFSFLILLTINTYASPSNNGDLIDLNGLNIGDSYEKTVEILGDNFEKELVIDESGYFGEDYYRLNYEGIVINIGKDSKEIIGIIIESNEIETNLGFKVGDSAQEVLEEYRSNYDELVSIHTNEPVTGWFKVSDDMVLIFDFDKDNYSRVNDEVTSNSKIEAIELTYIKYFD